MKLACPSLQSMMPPCGGRSGYTSVQSAGATPMPQQWAASASRQGCSPSGNTPADACASGFTAQRHQRPIGSIVLPPRHHRFQSGSSLPLSQRPKPSSSFFGADGSCSMVSKISIRSALGSCMPPDCRARRGGSRQQHGRQVERGPSGADRCCLPTWGQHCNTELQQEQQQGVERRAAASGAAQGASALQESSSPPAVHPQPFLAPWLGCRGWGPAAAARHPWCRAGCASRPGATVRGREGGREGSTA